MCQPSVERADPNISLRVLLDGTRIVAWQPFGHRKWDRATVNELIEPQLCAYPKTPLVVFEDRIHRTMRQTISREKRLKLAIAKSIETVTCANPQSVIA